MRCSVALAIACFSIAGLSVADDVTAAIRRNTNIPAQGLGPALQALAKERGFQVVYVSDEVNSLRTQGASGELTPEEALTQLLNDTGLTYRVFGDNAVGIVAIAAATSGSSSLLQGKEEDARRADESSSFWSRLRLAQAGQRETTRARGVEKQTSENSTSSQKRIELDEIRASIPEVLVYGSRSLNMDIQRTRDDPQPYVTYDREKIQQSGAQNLEAFLRDRLSMNASGLPHGQWVTDNGSQSNFNLRGLGANQTLILIDGHRASPGPAYGGTPTQSDVNNIPLAAIERIEVLPATASGIYGGGATGGVINIILRHDYVGAEVKATYGNSIASDVAQRRVDLSSGFNLEGGKTNVLLIGSFSDQNPLTLQERPELVERYYDIARANTPASLLPPNIPPLGATPNIRSADGSDLVLKSGAALNSSFTFIPVGYAGTATDGGAALLANAGQYNLNLADSSQHFTGGSTEISQTPRNASVRTSVKREFSPHVRAFLEGSFSELQTSSVRGVVDGGSISPYRVSASAPNNPFTSDIVVTVPTDSITSSIGTSVAHKRVLGGVIVSLPARWQAEMDYTWATTRHRADGVMLVSAGADAAVGTGAVDVLRDTGANPIDLSPFITEGGYDISQKVTFHDVALRLAGPVLELPAGPVSVSTLLEYRTDRFGDTTQHLPGLSLFYPSRSSSVSSAYLETRVPLVSAKNRIPGVRELDLQLAARADEYRTRGKTGFVIVGSNTPVVSSANETSSVNPTLALRYQPFEDLVLRTSYGTGFVAPDVSQLAQSIEFQPTTIIDPLRGGTSTTLPVGQVLRGGNPALGPEKSRNWSAGFILTPRILPDLRLSLDYTRIEKTDNIAVYPTGIQGIINDEALLPGRVQRGANLPGDPAGWAGPITLLDVSLINIASAEVEAFDLQLDYQWHTNLGTVGFSTVATRQTHYLTKSLAGQPTLENVGVAFNNPKGFTGSAELKWQHRSWTAGWLARYYHDYLTAEPSVAANAAHIALQGNGGRVPSQTYHDLFINWKPEIAAGGLTTVLQDTEFQLGIRNVFDKTPPFDAFLFNVIRLYHSSVADSLGATYQISMTKGF